MAYQFKSEIQDGSVKIYLEDNRFWAKFFPQKQEDVKHWLIKQNDLFSVQVDLKKLADEKDSYVTFHSDHLLLSHEAVAKLSEKTAKKFNLPPSPPLTLFISKEGIPGTKTFKLIADWRNHRDQTALTERNGCFLNTETGLYRIPTPIYEALELYDRSMRTADLLPETELNNIHWNALANFKAFFDDATLQGANDLFKLSDKMDNLKIRTASSLSLQLESDQDFNPVLFNKSITADPEKSDPISEKEGLLSTEEQRFFAKDEVFGFKRSAAAQGTYRLKENDFLVIDTNLSPVLDLVRQKQQAPEKERQEFCADPTKEMLDTLKSSLKEKQDYKNLSEDELEIYAEDALSYSYIETTDFQDRAISLGIWTPPNIQIEKFENNWRPEHFPLQLSNVNLTIAPHQIAPFKENFEQALSAGTSTIDFNGQAVDVTPENLTHLEDYQAIIDAQEIQKIDYPDVEEEILPPTEEPSKVKTHSVILKDNFEETDFDAKLTPRYSPLGKIIPKTIKSTLLDHQIDSLNWAIEAWTQGHAGILNADDQGLGKTLQTLSFITWLQETMAAASPDHRRPILIVAPTSLLKNWEAEVETHLEENALGFLTKAYGSDLRQLKKYGRKTKDAESNDANLEFPHIQKDIEKGRGHKNWVLTTYQTVANYLFSFREIPFATIIFDEIQSIKNPKAFKTHQARALQGDFRIGLTGTPIENSIADLWTILDSLSPNCLGPLKEFLKKYQNLEASELDKLYSFLFKGKDKHPAIALRRMKEEVLEGLPDKFYKLHRQIMPPKQKERYDEINSKLGEIKPSNALAELNHIRSISLHPYRHDFIEDIEEFTANSARFQCLIDILKDIEARQERALIFLEDRDMQYVVQTIIQSLFNLENVNIINGQTVIHQRQAYVDKFQQHLVDDNGFDVLILAPRAAGVGLTITAATHVIHLSRWWNPAVEEQCNDRIYRIGQKKDVTIHIPLAIHPTYKQYSFDCVLNDLMIRKKSISSNVLYPPEVAATDNDFLTKGLFVEATAIPNFTNAEDFSNWTLERLNSVNQWTSSKSKEKEDIILFSSKFKKNNQGQIFNLYQDSLADKIDTSKLKNLMRHLQELPEKQRRNSYILTNSNSEELYHKFQEIGLSKHNIVTWQDLPLWPQHILT